MWGGGFTLNEQLTLERQQAWFHSTFQPQGILNASELDFAAQLITHMKIPYSTQVRVWLRKENLNSSEKLDLAAMGSLPTSGIGLESGLADFTPF